MKMIMKEGSYWLTVILSALLLFSGLDWPLAVVIFLIEVVTSRFCAKIFFAWIQKVADRHIETREQSVAKCARDLRVRHYRQRLTEEAKQYPIRGTAKKIWHRCFSFKN